MEDNSAVVTMANNDSGYTKKCKHFLMVLNYIKEQIALGQFEAHKIYGKLNHADMHTKPLRSSEYKHMALRILGQPQPNIPIPTPSLTAEIAAPYYAADTAGQPRTGAKRALRASPYATTTDAATSNAKRRKAHLLRFITPSVADSKSDAVVVFPAV